MGVGLPYSPGLELALGFLDTGIVPRLPDNELPRSKRMKQI
jgi:hypothetical protein